MENKKENEIVLYTVKDIKRILGIGHNQVYDLVNTRGFPKIQIGRKYLVPKDKFEKWIYVNIGKSIKLIK